MDKVCPLSGNSLITVSFFFLSSLSLKDFVCFLIDYITWKASINNLLFPAMWLTNIIRSRRYHSLQFLCWAQHLFCILQDFPLKSSPNTFQTPQTLCQFDQKKKQCAKSSSEPDTIAVKSTNIVAKTCCQVRETYSNWLKFFDLFSPHLSSVFNSSLKNKKFLVLCVHTDNYMNLRYNNK